MVLKSNWKWVSLLVMIALSLTSILAGCGENSSISSPTGKPSSTQNLELRGTISETGSTTVQPLAEKLAGAFTNRHPQVNIIIQGGGSSLGIKAAYDGTVDLGASSRELTSGDPPVITHLIARDGIAIIINPANPVSSLTTEQIKDIYSGKINRWSQVGGPDEEIHVSAREEGSGTRTAFEEMIMGKDATIVPRAILQSSNGALIQVIKSDPWAIGFVSFGYLDRSVKAVAINGVEATESNARNGTYPIVRPLYFLTKNQPAGLVKAFLDFCMSEEAQTIVREEGYVSIK